MGFLKVIRNHSVFSFRTSFSYFRFKMSIHPVCVLVFSGKRKSGKDYITELLQTSLGKDKCSILRLSGPLKGQYAKENGLDFQRLLDASDYKEKYRADMIRWGEEKRNADPGYFCRLICKGEGSQLPLWIISDARRKTDVEYFKEHFADRLLTVRVEADDAVRAARGWTFTSGVDDAESECGLDNRSWDFVIDNNGDSAKLDQQLSLLIERATSRF